MEYRWERSSSHPGRDAKLRQPVPKDPKNRRLTEGTTILRYDSGVDRILRESLPFKNEASTTLVRLAMPEIYKIDTLNINGMATLPRIAMLEDILHKQEIDTILLQVTRPVFNNI